MILHVLCQRRKLGPRRCGWVLVCTPMVACMGVRGADVAGALRLSVRRLDAAWTQLGRSSGAARRPASKPCAPRELSLHCRGPAQRPGPLRASGRGLPPPRRGRGLARAAPGAPVARARPASMWCRRPRRGRLEFRKSCSPQITEHLHSVRSDVVQKVSGHRRDVALRAEPRPTSTQIGRRWPCLGGFGPDMASLRPMFGQT